MYITNCKENTYFEITEIWFHYNERIEYAKRGIEEGTVVYILKNNDEQITVNSESNIETSFTYDEALNICGEPLQKKPKIKSMIKK